MMKVTLMSADFSAVEVLAPPITKHLPVPKGSSSLFSSAKVETLGNVILLAKPATDSNQQPPV